MNGYWVVRTYEAGAVGEKTKFWVPGERPSKSGRREKQELRKQEQNEQSAEKSMARLLNANFHQGDLLLGLDYSEEGMQRILSWAREKGLPVDGSEEERMDAVREAAEHELRLVLRRVNREMAKAGVALRYVAITSDMDGDTGETVPGTSSPGSSGRGKGGLHGEVGRHGWRGLVPHVGPGGLHPDSGLPDPTGAESTGREKVCEQPEPGAPAAERPRGPDRGGTARAERGETASPKTSTNRAGPSTSGMCCRRTSSTGRRLAKKTA